MASITLQLSDELLAELSETAEQLKCTPEECIELALTHFIQSPALVSSAEALARLNDNQPLTDFPELKEELDLDIQFHPMAMEELDSLTEEEQVTVLEDLVNRISGENDDLEDLMDLVIKETPDHQIVLSEFSFGHVVYKIGTNIVVYYVGILEDDTEDLATEENEMEES
jgi:hypothetical protein